MINRGRGSRSRAVLALCAVALGTLAACSGTGSEDIIGTAPDVDDSARGPDAGEQLSVLVSRLRRADLFVTYRVGDREEPIAVDGDRRASATGDFFYLEDGNRRTLCIDGNCESGNFNTVNAPGGSVIDRVDLVQLPLTCHDPVERRRGNCDLRIDEPRTIAGRDAVCVEGFLDRDLGGRERRCYDAEEGVLLYYEGPGGLVIEAIAARPTTEGDFAQ